MHGLVASAIFLWFSMGFMGNSFLAVLLIYSYIFHYRRLISLSSTKSVSSIEYLLVDSQWRITFQDNRELQLTLLSSSFVSQWLVILVFCDSSQRIYSSIIPFDGVSTDKFRQLRVSVTHFNFK